MGPCGHVALPHGFWPSTWTMASLSMVYNAHGDDSGGIHGILCKEMHLWYSSLKATLPKAFF